MAQDNGSAAFPDRQFGGRVRAYRDKKGWSQKDLAAECTKWHRNLSNREISKIENGRKHCDPVLAGILARALGTTVDALKQAEYTERPAIFDRIEKVVPGATLNGPYALAPRAIDIGDFQPSECAKATRDEVARGIRINEPHAFVTDIDRKIREPEIKFEVSDYVTLVSEAACGKKVRPLHAGAILVSKERCSIFVHKRSETVRIMKNYYHTFSGNFIARGHDAQRDYTLLDTCIREVNEEVHVAVTPATDVPIVICEERDPLPQHAVIVMWLGVDLTAEQSGRLKGSPEGKVREVPFEDIMSHLISKLWVPSGMAHVLAWLGLGAPGATLPFREKAPKICDGVLSALADKPPPIA
jgi:transcriptional regulator with XRE-family HTH domain/ADP-ribose pyrophosphatase YjhB (NUDIX family)